MWKFWHPEIILLEQRSYAVVCLCTAWLLYMKYRNSSPDSDCIRAAFEEAILCLNQVLVIAWSFLFTEPHVFGLLNRETSLSFKLYGTVIINQRCVCVCVFTCLVKLQFSLNGKHFWEFWVSCQRSLSHFVVCKVNMAEERNQQPSS